MTYTCLLVDDEPLAHKVLISHIRQKNNLRLLKQCYTAAEARQYLFQHPVDILFLDIEMPEETGIQLLQSLSRKPVTIFTTAFLHYSLEGFELGVIDYLIKPIRFERFEKAVKRATDFLQLLQLRAGIETSDPEGSTILIKTGNKKITVSRSNVSHVQALKDYVILYCGSDKHVVRSTMKEIAGILGSAGFLRVHKSFIVSKSKIRCITANKIEFDGSEIPIGRKYRKSVEVVLAQ
ncbi:MAG: response regulator transcription factor [Ferruginibacter sp.]